MKTEQIAAIRAKCIEAHPEIDHIQEAAPGRSEALIDGRPIRLADVLLAWETKYEELPDQTIGRGMEQLWSIYCKWSLRADDLDQQSDETISFIHDLLK